MKRKLRVTSFLHLALAFGALALIIQVIDIKDAIGGCEKPNSNDEYCKAGASWQPCEAISNAQSNCPAERTMCNVQWPRGPEPSTIGHTKQQLTDCWFTGYCKWDTDLAVPACVGVIGSSPMQREAKTVEKDSIPCG